MRTALAVITGYITIAVLVFVTDVIIGVVLHGGREAFSIVNLVTALPYAAVGGYLAARISEGTEKSAAIGLSAFGTLIAILALTRDPGRQPLWYSIVLLILFALGALAGGYLRMRQTHKLVK